MRAPRHSSVAVTGALPNDREQASAISTSSAAMARQGIGRKVCKVALLRSARAHRTMPAGLHMTDFIDNHGYRANVGIVLMNGHDRLFLGGRTGGRGWQFPQGGIQRDEELMDALFRELTEEIGLGREDVTVLASTANWLHYR